MSKLFISLLLITGAHSTPLQQGENCGVNGADFLSPNFLGNVSVAGNGCVSGSDKNCLCAPNFDDEQSLSYFLWQCNGSVEFGPKNGKVCPERVPIINEIGVDSIYFKESEAGVPVPCNTTIHPTGRPDDEACGYSECETGGSYSAICGCVDLGNRSEVEASGMQWVCLHSTCGCSLTDPTLTSTISASRSSTPLIVAALAASASFIMAGL